ncbi:MAG: hypothetical protein ACKVXR_01475 [Planctomycetota bacterium]
MGKRARVALRIVLVLLVSAALLEVGARLLERTRGRRFDTETLRTEIVTHLGAVSPRVFIRGGHQDMARAATAPDSVILSPYTAWEDMALQARVASDHEYYRRPESEAVYDIVVLGGSVANGFGKLGATPLLELLSKDPAFQGRELRLHNYGVAGFKQMQQVMLLGYLFDWGHRPDAVIEIDGFNESAIGTGNAVLGVHPAYPSISQWARAAYGIKTDFELVRLLHAIRVKQDRATAFGAWLLDSGLWRSAFLGQVGKTVLVRFRQAYIDQFFVYQSYVAEHPTDIGSKGPRFSSDGESVSAAILTAWEESSISMDSMCAARGITYLHVLQPALHDPGSKTLTAQEIETGSAGAAWIEGIHRNYPRLREAGRRLSERGIAFLDATGVFRDHPETIYADACHFEEHGNAIFAAAIAPALVAAARK